MVCEKMLTVSIRNWLCNDVLPAQYWCSSSTSRSCIFWHDSVLFCFEN